MGQNRGFLRENEAESTIFYTFERSETEFKEALGLPAPFFEKLHKKIYKNLWNF